MIDLGSLRDLSVDKWEALCRHLLPAGKRKGRYWEAGSILGEPGKSFNVNLSSGVFGDWAVDDKKQRGPINFWMQIRGVDFKTAVEELSAWLGRSTDIFPVRSTRSNPTDEGEKKIFFPPDLCQPTEKDLRTLSQSRSIGIEALRIAAKRGFLRCFDDQLNGRCWLFTDQRRRCGLRRRLDNELFELRDGSKVKCASCKGSDMSRPLGHQEAAHYPCIGVVEGAPNALAVIAHSWANGLKERVAPICLPSTTSNFTQFDLAYLQGKKGRIFIDDDAAGKEAAKRWAAQLKQADIEVDAFSFTGLVMSDGRPVADLNDLLCVDYDCWEEHRQQIESVMTSLLQANNYEKKD
jgi:hypothetical protein